MYFLFRGRCDQIFSYACGACSRVFLPSLPALSNNPHAGQWWTEEPCSLLACHRNLTASRVQGQTRKGSLELSITPALAETPAGSCLPSFIHSLFLFFHSIVHVSSISRTASFSRVSFLCLLLWSFLVNPAESVSISTHTHTLAFTHTHTYVAFSYLYLFNRCTQSASRSNSVWILALANTHLGLFAHRNLSVTWHTHTHTRAHTPTQAQKHTHCAIMHNSIS